MENLRWILIFAGVAILVLLWISGRSGRRDADAANAPDPLLGDDPMRDGFGDAFGDVDPDDLARPGAPAGGSRVRRSQASASGGGAIDPAWGHEGDVDGYGGAVAARRATSADPAPAFAAGVAEPQGLGGTLARKFEAFGEKLAPGRRRRAAALEAIEDDEAPAPPAFDSKIVTLHVVAPAGDILPPEALRDMFERRGYHHGDMNIYHSLYQGKTVFSVARMVKPGTFDLDDIATFETPGLALILQLPGPVAADTAFEVMLEEAFEMADELGGAVLDGNRSTLGRQTQQHLREDIHEYMHRQKYFESVA